MYITPQPGEIYDRKLKVIASVMNATMTIIVNNFVGGEDRI